MRHQKQHQQLQPSDHMLHVCDVASRPHRTMRMKSVTSYVGSHKPYLGEAAVQGGSHVKAVSSLASLSQRHHGSRLQGPGKEQVQVQQVGQLVPGQQR